MCTYSWRVPLTTAGVLTITAFSDLGGLGDTAGVPVSYNWTGAGLIKPMLPWLGILLLLALKPNRNGRAWWILAPLLLTAGVLSWVLPLFDQLPSELIDIISETFTALSFAFAALWLLATYLACRHRFVTFLCFAPVLAFSSLLVLVVQKDWGGISSEDEFAQTVAGFVILGLGVGIGSLVLFLSGLITRRRWRPVILTLLSMGMTCAMWLLFSLPIFIIITMIMNGRGLMWRELFTEVLPMVLVMAGMNFGVMLPFLVLSWVNSLFRERLMGLLHIARNAPDSGNAMPKPPPIAPPVPPAAG